MIIVSISTDATHIPNSASLRKRTWAQRRVGLTGYDLANKLENSRAFRAPKNIITTVI